MAQAHPCCDNHQTKQLPVKQHTFHISEVATRETRIIKPFSRWHWLLLLIVGWLPPRCVVSTEYFQVWPDSNYFHTVLYKNFSLGSRCKFYDCSPTYKWTKENNKIQTRTQLNHFLSLGGILQPRKQSQFDQAFFIHCFTVFSVFRVSHLGSNL